MIYIIDYKKGKIEFKILEEVLNEEETYVNFLFQLNKKNYYIIYNFKINYIIIYLANNTFFSLLFLLVFYLILKFLFHQSNFHKPFQPF